MRILITGNLGYIGPEVIRYIKANHPEHTLIGYDNAYFSHCLSTFTPTPEHSLDKQYYGDVRNISDDIFQDVDSVIHLAAISNDPMGNNFTKITNEINFQCSLKIAKMASAHGVKNFVFASSCSVYGESTGEAKTEMDSVLPLTAYAKSKIDTERGLAEEYLPNLTITNLRFATACGVSSRFRLDLVLNDFIHSAYSKKTIDIISDGSPWRPLIDVEDMARALYWAATRDTNHGNQFLTINTGSNENNFQILDLAEIIADEIGGIKININKNAAPDKRSYKVNFNKFKDLAPNYYPKKSIQNTISQTLSLVSKLESSQTQSMDDRYKRLSTLNCLIRHGKLDQRLAWQM